MASQVIIMLITRLVCVLIVSAAGSGLGTSQTSKTGCRSVMTSVRMEVSPLMVHAICRDNSSAALAITCGEAVWIEDIQGFCNSFDLNIGQVLMNRTLPSTTLTLHLVKLGEILDAARVVILTPQEVRHYRISVWGHQNTRFVLTIASKCPPDTPGQTSKPFREGPSVAESPTPISTIPSYSTPPSTVVTGAPSHVMGGIENNAPLPEYTRPNNLPKSQLDELRASPTTIFGQKSVMSRGRKKVNAHRSKVPVSPNDTERERILLHGSQKEDPEGNPENYELAKLQWMEDKRVLFEKKFELIQKQFQPNASGEDYKDYRDYKDYNTDSVEDVSRELNISPSDANKQSSPGNRGKVNDASYSPNIGADNTEPFKEIKEDINTANVVDKTSQKQDSRESTSDTTTLKSRAAPEIQVLSNQKQESFQTQRPVKISFRTLNNEDLPLVVAERDSSAPEAAVEGMTNPTVSSVSNESLASSRSPASTPDGGLPLFLNFPLELFNEGIESSSVLDVQETSVLDEQVITPSVSFSGSLFTVSPTSDSVASTVTHVPVMILETSSETYQTSSILTSVVLETSSSTTILELSTGLPGTTGPISDGNVRPTSSWQQTLPTDVMNHASASHSSELTSTLTPSLTTHDQLLPTSTVGHTSELTSHAKQDEISQHSSNGMLASLSSTSIPVIETSTSHADTLTLQTSITATLASVAPSHSSEIKNGDVTSSSRAITSTLEPSVTASVASVASAHSSETFQTSSSSATTQPSASATFSQTPSTSVAGTVSDVTTTPSTTAPSSNKPNKPTLPNFTIGIPVLPTGDDSATTANATLHPEGNEGEGISDAQFWPLVASLVIGIPAIVVIGIGVTVIHRRRKPDPQKMYHMKALRATGTPKMSAGSDTLRSTMMHQTSVEV